MDNSQTIFEGFKCPLWMKEMLDRMVTISNGMKCMKTPESYFRSLYGQYKYEKLKFKATEPSSEITLHKFLEDVECKIINLMYNKICEKFVSNGVLSTPIELPFNGNFTEETDSLIDSITNNDILSIDCPTIFTGYHFIFAVVSSNGLMVNIYQSFGNRVLYKNTLPIEKFKQHLKNMKNIKTYPREKALEMVKAFEDEVYLSNFDQKFDEMANEDSDTKSVDSVEDESIPKEELIDDMFDRLILQRDTTISIKLYKFNHSDCDDIIGGKKRKRNKTHKKSNSKKLKRKVRKTRRN